MSNYNYLYDKDFLLKLDVSQHKETYARIATLTWDELPIEYIEGKLTGGTINIDGSSSLRRTCSLTLVANDVALNEFYWGLNTKFKLEVGVKNTIEDSGYSDIIWFPQGVFILTTFNTSVQASGRTISLTGKDKMCMLNGDLGGHLDSTVDFGAETYYDLETKQTTITKLPILSIIPNLLCSFGNELLRNIIVTDVDKYGYELLDYYGDKPLYLLKKWDENIYLNLTFNDLDCTIVKGDKDAPDGTTTTLSGLGNWVKGYDSGVNQEGAISGYVITLTKGTQTDEQGELMKYTVRQLSAGDVVGYRLSDLVYAGDLIAAAGDTITSVLDKIVKMLGNFEYFYDEYGRFVFQEKKNNIYSDWNNIEVGSSGLYINPLASPIAYSFQQSPLITAISHNPQLAKIKNDYSIWGKKKLPSGIEADVHLRYALEKKPEYYKSFDGVEYFSETTDWREIIYQMARDFYKHGQEEDFNIALVNNNGHHYPSGKTGYEGFYIDLDKEWRTIYNPEFKQFTENQPNKNIVYYTGNFVDGQFVVSKQLKWDEIFTLKTGSNMFAQGITIYDSLQNEIKFKKDDSSDIDDSQQYYYYNDNGDFVEYTDIYKIKNSAITYYYREKDNGNYLYNQDGKEGYWITDVSRNPSKIPFWFDFFGEGTSLEKYMISSIGDRSKVINDKDVSAIYFAEIPDILFMTVDQYSDVAGTQDMPAHYTIIALTPQMQNLFTISTQGKDAQKVFEEALYDNSYLNDTINITAIPIYHLPVNSRIEVFDQDSEINGEYIISKITLPLTYNGTMQITASKSETIIY